MQKLRRRLDLQENGSSGGNESASGGVSSGRSSQSATPHDNLSQASRASSNTSLNTLEYHNDTSSQTQVTGVLISATMQKYIKITGDIQSIS